MSTFTALVAGVLGAACGSFLNVVIHRVPRGGSLLRPPSSCPQCNAPIRALDNVPLVSYVLLGGRCRSCGARISARYPLVEVVTAALWAGAVLRFDPGEEAVFVAIAGGVLVAVTAIDFEHRRIPNVIVLPATAALSIWVLATAAVRGEWSIAIEAFGSAAAAFGLLFVLAVATGGIGFGDVKLVWFVGLVTGRFGWRVTVVAIFGAFFVGGLVAAALLVSGRRGRKDAIPFGPSLAAGTLIGLYGGPELVSAWFGIF